jgi:hypothetical protein
LLYDPAVPGARWAIFCKYWWVPDKPSRTNRLKRRITINVARKSVSTLGGIFLAALLIAALAPKATRSIAVALVQVANTPSDPVPNRDVDDRDRADIGYAACNVRSSSGLGIVSNDSCFTVPAGRRFVIDQVDGLCTTGSGNAVGFATLSFTTGGLATTAYLVLTPQAPLFGAVEYTLNQPVHYVADPGSTLGIGAETSDLTGDTFCTFNFSGHFVSYP